MSESNVSNRRRNINKRLSVSSLKPFKDEELFISGFPSVKIGVVRNLALNNQTPMSLLMFGVKQGETNFFTDEGTHCYIESLKNNQCVCSQDYLPKVERSWAKQKAVLLGFTHIEDKPGAEALTGEEVQFMVDMGTRNRHDVNALLITGDSEVALKYSFEADEIFILRSTVI